MLMSQKEKLESQKAAQRERLRAQKERLRAQRERLESSEGKVESSGQTKKRLSFEDLQAQIITIAQDYVTMEEIAINTQKKLQYLVNKIIPRMLQAGTIERLCRCPAILNKNIRQLIRTINKQYEYTANTAFFHNSIIVKYVIKGKSRLFPYFCSEIII